ncbi:MAG: acetylornithine deacetylase [Bacteroidota bacterium]
MTSAEILKQLVSFPTISKDSNLDLIHWVQNYLKDFGVDSKLVPNPENTKANLHARIGPAEDGGIVLSGHSDVVPVEGQPWESDPFVLTDKGDGKLYGRGSCDMKGFLANCLATLPEMTKAPLKKPIYFAFSYDEEVGCTGAPDLIADIQNYYEETPKFALIGEPSLMQPVVGQKGIYIMEVQVNGSAGHSSRIRQEVSAIHESARLILWLEDRMNKLVEVGQLDHRFDPPHTSMHVGVIQGGIAPNVVADKAFFTWDVRTIPKDNLPALIQEFKDFCKGREDMLRKVFPKFAIKFVEYHPPVPPLDTADDQEVVALVKSLSGRNDLGAVSYAAEAGQFSDAGFQSIICGPGSIEQAHRANEFMAKDQLIKGEEMLLRLTQAMS